MDLAQCQAFHNGLLKILTAKYGSSRNRHGMRWWQGRDGSDLMVTADPDNMFMSYTSPQTYAAFIRDSVNRDQERLRKAKDVL